MGGGGGLISSIFGGAASTPSAPAYKEPEYTPPPTREAEQEAEAKSVRDDEKRKLKAKRGMSGTILTSPLGADGGQGNSGGLLGNIGQ